MKIKLSFGKKEPNGNGAAGAGPPGAPPAPGAGVPPGVAALSGQPASSGAGPSNPPIAPRAVPVSGGQPAPGAAGPANPPAPKTIKLKLPTGPIGGGLMMSAAPLAPPPGAKPRKPPKPPKRPAVGHHAGGAFGSGPPAAKKFKLGGGGAAIGITGGGGGLAVNASSIKLKGTMNLAGTHFPAPMPVAPAAPGRGRGRGRGRGGIPHAVVAAVAAAAPGGPKKRGRKPKYDPDSKFMRELYTVDEVTYNIAAPPPRQHSLRQVASQTLFGDGGEEGSPPPSAGPQEALPEEAPRPVFPLTPPTVEELRGLVSRLWARDKNGIFHNPVSLEAFPDYGEVIQHPIDLTTIRGKLEAGGADAYPTWEAFWDDLDLMFTNAQTYNPPGDSVHKYAGSIRKVAASAVTNVRKGGKSSAAAAEAKKHQAAARKAAAAQKAERDAAARAARAEQKQAQEEKIMRRAGVGAEAEEAKEEPRATYKALATLPGAALWGGLYGGCSAAGAAFGYARVVAKPSTPEPSAERYAASIARFAEGLSGRALELVLARVETARAAAENVVPRADPPAGGGGGATAQSGGPAKRGRKPKDQPAAAAAPVPAAAVKQPAVPLFQNQAGGVGAGLLPPAAPLAMGQPGTALAAAHNAQLLATQAAGQVAAFPPGMVFPPGMMMPAPLGALPGQFQPQLQVQPLSTGLPAAGQVLFQPPQAPGPQ